MKLNTNAFHYTHPHFLQTLYQASMKQYACVTLIMMLYYIHVCTLYVTYASICSEVSV